MQELGPFQNNPSVDWSREENRIQMREALEKVRKELEKTYPLIIGGKEFYTKETITSVNPAHFNEIVGVVAKADSILADKAVEVAQKAWRDWKKVPEKRVEYTLRAAEIMRQKKFELMAWEVFEAGKNWLEADGDVAEAIDFLEYYSREMIRLSGWHLTPQQIPGETNQFRFVPKGVGLVLGIWNFILAINAGMTSANLVAGNTVVFKPASLTPVMGYKLVEIYQEAGIPDGVINYLPGAGKEVGEYLVKHPGVNLINLTGSKEVGRRVIKLAGEYPPERDLAKKVIPETGGKNAGIIDSDADLDQAVRGTLVSAFGFQGQKCSAESRCITLIVVHDAFLERLVEAAKSIKIGDPQYPENFMGPLIDESALEKVRRYVRIGKREGKLALERKVPEDLREKGYYHGPVIFTDVDPHSRIAQEEIFGPVLAIIKAKDFDQALEIANDCGFALTGGGYSRSPEHIEKTKEELEAGNKYINRKITGSIVGRQPFGGYKCSGTGCQAGGPDYLQQFMNIEVVSENTMRRGFTIEKES